MWGGEEEDDEEEGRERRTWYRRPCAFLTWPEI